MYLIGAAWGGFWADFLKSVQVERVAGKDLKEKKAQISTIFFENKMRTLTSVVPHGYAN
jgi:hypothetical protein